MIKINNKEVKNPYAKAIIYLGLLGVIPFIFLLIVPILIIGALVLLILMPFVAMGWIVENGNKKR